MQKQYVTCQQAQPVPPYEACQMAQAVGGQLASFLFPLLVQLDGVLDKRLVRTFLATIQVIITFRDRANGLLLSELGAYLAPPDKAPAGTKRLSNLLHSGKWAAWLIARFLWQRASQQLEAWTQAGEEGLVIWDESVWEKPESQHAEGLCAVRSSKAKRLTHYKKGFYSPPPKPIFVPGLQWIGLLLVGRHEQQGPPLLAAMRWWSSRGGRASFKRDEEAKLLLTCAAQWGRRVVHVFDQGFVGGLWLGLLVALNLRFVLSFRKAYQLIDAQGNKRKAWHIARGKRGSAERLIWDSRRTRWVQASVLVLPVQHPEQPNVALSLVVCRSAGRLPWYLLTNEAVSSEDEAWRIVFAYVRRWTIEQTWRYEKSELADHQPTPLALAGTREALADGPAFLCLSPDALRALLRPVARLAAAHVLSSHGLALPHGQSTPVSAAQRPLPALATASAQLRAAGATSSAPRARARRVRASR